MRGHVRIVVAAVAAVFCVASSCAGPLMVPQVGGGDGAASRAGEPTSVRCSTPTIGAGFETVAPEDVALDRAALGRAVSYATQRGAQSVRVYRHGCLVGRGGLDPYTELQRLPAWSMTKGVVSTVVGRAVALGLIGVDDPIGTHLGGLRPEVASLTVRHFLTQTSGLRMAWGNDLWAAGSTDSVADVLARPFQAEPGSTFLYAQTAVTVLVAVVEAASGQDFQDFARSEVFEPIGITRSLWRWQRDGSGRTQGFAFLDMAPVAWARLGHLLLGNGSWNGRQLIDPAYMADGRAGTMSNPGYGFLWWTNAGDRHVDSGFPAYQHKETEMWPGLPRDTFAYSGLFDQDMIVIPSLDMVVVRMGLPPEVFGDPLGESTGLRPKFAWRFHRLLMQAVSDVDVPDPGPWVYDGPNPAADPYNLIEPTLPPFEAELPPWLRDAFAG